MRSSDDSILSSSRNAFSPSFLHRIGERDEPPTAGEADTAGPWRVLELPGTGRDTAFHLQKDSGPEGFAVEAGNGGEVVGYLELFDPNLIEALHVAEGLLRSPETLAVLLEAAGQIALERAGSILDARIPE
jgi:hypothetical protein